MDEKTQELLKRLPRTFRPALNAQLKDWDRLFPAERRSFQAQLDWLERLPSPRFEQLFAPVLKLEERMDLPAAWGPSTAGLSIEDTGVLVRSPLYPQWRAEVERVFGEIDGGIAAEVKSRPPRNLVVCTLPAGLAAASGPIWPRLESRGRWVELEAPFASMLEPLARAVAARPTRPDIDPVERTWVFEYAPRLTRLPLDGPAVGLCFESLAGLRREFLSRLNVISKDIRSADRAFEQLRATEINQFLSPSLKAEVRVREFTREIFLSGNGALLFGNSFVQWGASEAFRRVRMQAVFCSFGVRPKLKPFSSLVLFEDQNRANPVPDQPDPEGSWTDTRLLAEYVYLAAERAQVYDGQTMGIFALPELSRALLTAWPGPAPAGRLGAEDVIHLALEWLA
jgi:hypothetical protein